MHFSSGITPLSTAARAGSGEGGGAGSDEDDDMTVITTGNFNTPVPYLDIDTSDAEYTEFLLRMHNVCLDADDDNSDQFGLGILASPDGGSTWVFDGVHNDSYAGGYSSGIVTGSPHLAAPKATSIHIRLWPGDAIVLPHWFSIWNNSWLDFNSNTWADGLNPAATTAPTVQRLGFPSD